MITIQFTRQEVDLLVVAVSHGLHTDEVPEADRAGIREVLKKIGQARDDAPKNEEPARDATGA